MPQSYPTHNPKTILIGEDDIDDQEFLKEIFSSIDRSLSIQFASNGSQLLSHLEKSQDGHLPCLIILDYNMPGLNGAEILAELKKSHRYEAIPKVIWSTSRSHMYKEKCLELGANDYIVKPSNVKALEEAARHMLTICD